MNFARSWVEVSLSTITDNFAVLKEAVGAGVEVLAVVKADAYRHGAGAVAAALESAGARHFGVASVEEGLALRSAGIRGTILVLTGFLPSELDTAVHHNLTPVVHSCDELDALEESAVRLDRRLPYHLKIDTGLGRLGSRARREEIAAAIRRAAHCGIEGLMTHFASSEDFDDGSFERQLAGYEEIQTHLETLTHPSAYLHLSNSSAIVYGRRGAWKNMVRPGLSLYGYVSCAKGSPPARLAGLRPALTWKARILAVKDVAAGSAIGYGATFRTKTNLRVAVVAAGYADGYPHRLGNRGAVIVHGRFASVIGAVSMDLLTVDVTACPSIAPGDSATLLGSEGGATMDALELARRADTIPYVILCGIGKRVACVHT